MQFSPFVDERLLSLTLGWLAIGEINLILHKVSAFIGGHF